MSYKPQYVPQQAVIFNWKEGMMNPTISKPPTAESSSVMDLVKKALWAEIRPSNDRVKSI